MFTFFEKLIKPFPPEMPTPIKADEPYPGHGILIQENGIYILETMNTGELADDNVSEFLFVLGPAKVRGAVRLRPRRQ